MKLCTKYEYNMEEKVFLEIKCWENYHFVNILNHCVRFSVSVRIYEVHRWLEDDNLWVESVKNTIHCICFWQNELAKGE